MQRVTIGSVGSSGRDLLRTSLVGVDEFDAACVIEEDDDGRLASAESAASSASQLRASRRGKETINPLEGLDSF